MYLETCLKLIKLNMSPLHLTGCSAFSFKALKEKQNIHVELHHYKNKNYKKVGQHSKLSYI